MNRKQALKLLGLGTAMGMISGPALCSSLFKAKHFGARLPVSKDDLSGTPTAYLMAYFKSSKQQLFYAYSEDCLSWTPLNGGNPVLETSVNLRDPFIGKANGKFHLVHTKGWDFPVIYHYESDDLLDWVGGEIQVVSDEKKRAWAPEWYYEEKEGLFYVFWASIHNGHNTIFYLKTKDWKNIHPSQSKIYYDLGIDDIDFTATKVKKGPKPGYYAFHKPGSLEDNFSVECMYSPTINPEDPNFSFGNNKTQFTDMPQVVKPIEGPEIIQLNQEDKWYVYADPFHQPFVAWETTDFAQFNPIRVQPPAQSKHCSILGLTSTELAQLKKRYPV